MQTHNLLVVMCHPEPRWLRALSLGVEAQLHLFGLVAPQRRPDGPWGLCPVLLVLHTAEMVHSSPFVTHKHLRHIRFDSNTKEKSALSRPTQT